MINKFTKYFCFVLIIISGLFQGCKKIPFDSRNKYWGDWKFTCSSYSWSYPQGAGNTITEEFTGKIYYDKGKDKKSIIIEYNSNKMLFEVDYDGNLIGCGSSGKFESENSVSFDYSSSACTLALGAGSYATFKGTKK
jgi:hypothetical protein